MKHFDLSKIKNSFNLRRTAKNKSQKTNSDNSERNTAYTGTEKKAIIQEDLVDTPDLRNLIELQSLFKRPDFSVFDGMNEYDDDFTCFMGRNGVFTHEMKRSISRSLVQQNKVSSDSSHSNIVVNDDIELKKSESSTKHVDPN